MTFISELHRFEYDFLFLGPFHVDKIDDDDSPQYLGGVVVWQFLLTEASFCPSISVDSWSLSWLGFNFPLIQWWHGRASVCLRWSISSLREADRLSKQAFLIFFFLFQNFKITGFTVVSLNNFFFFGASSPECRIWLIRKWILLYSDCVEWIHWAGLSQVRPAYSSLRLILSRSLFHQISPFLFQLVRRFRRSLSFVTDWPSATVRIDTPKLAGLMEVDEVLRGAFFPRRFGSSWIRWRNPEKRYQRGNDR